ncbi:MAG: hypothetical protein JNJ57_19350 [Saprospiraceae bacterium]|nr:hypothetical protein [Saprospiraceae bacterium]
MNANLFNRKTLLSGALIALAFGLNAQVKSTQTDEKYANTTVVYKDKAANDQDVLNTLGSEYGMGDVIRVTVAPPKPAAAPVIDKSKGQDVWLGKPKTQDVRNLTASNANQPVLNVKPAAPAVSPAVAPKAVQQAVKNSATPSPVAVETATPETPKTEEAVSAAPVSTMKAKTASGASKSGKAYKKPGKKSGKGYGKTKSRKHGKQRYGCARF